MRDGLRAGMLAFATAAATLFSQILVHRLIAAKLRNNYAFFVISLTMLGFALSGVILSRYRSRLLGAMRETIVLGAAFFALTLLGASYVFCQAGSPHVEVSHRAFVVNLMQVLPLTLLFALPFTFTGLVLGALLAAPQLPTRRIYFWDLLGSACGALFVLPCISNFGVEKALVGVCAILLTGALVLAPPRRLSTWLLPTAAGLVIAVVSVAPERVFALRYPDGSMLAGLTKLPPPMGLEHIAWDPTARIEVTRIPPPLDATNSWPSLTGRRPEFLQRFRRVLTQNNFAFTYAVDYDGRPQSLAGIEDTIYAAAYQATSVPRARVLVVGVGGGFDVLTALRFNASRVTGVEINAATVRILTDVYRDYFKAWVTDPRVRLVNAEGRHFLETSQERYDVIQLSGVDSYSGTAAAAHVFSENYLYTQEAFDLYLRRLSQKGIINMMRLEHKPPREMLRAMVTAVAALRRAGVQRPADHIAAVTVAEENFTALLVKKSPFSGEELARLERWTAALDTFGVSASPSRNGGKSNIYQLFLGLDDARAEADVVRLYPYDISPVTDNRPFFFRFSFWWHLLPDSGMGRASIPVLETSTLVLLSIVSVATLLCIYLPLRWFARAGLRNRGALRGALFFGGTGLGYLAIELALIQKFGLLLGHPNYSLSVVLAVLLLTTGLGSLFSAGIVRVLGHVRVVSYVLAALIFAQYLFVLPHLKNLVGQPFWLRATVASVLVGVVGVPLGTFVPSAIEQLKASAPAFVPWAWGINGVFSVLAPILSVAFSMSWGINALLLAAVPVYLVVGFSMPGVDGGAMYLDGPSAAAPGS